jgi:hypothetical protein
MLVLVLRVVYREQGAVNLWQLQAPMDANRPDRMRASPIDIIPASGLAYGVCIPE